MKIKWSRFDNWFVKVAGFVLVSGGLAWTVYSVVDHYKTKATDWEYFPFMVSGLAIVFGAALLSRRAAAGATAVVLPLLDRLPFGKKPTTSSVLVPPQPAQPAQPAKVVTTTVTPLPEVPPTSEEAEMRHDA